MDKSSNKQQHIDQLLRSLKDGRLTTAEVMDQIKSVKDCPDAAGVSRQDGPHPLSQGQQGLWVLQAMQPDSVAYNVPLALHLHGAWRAEMLQAALDALVRRHPLLVSAIRQDEGGLVQVPHPEGRVMLVPEDGGDLSGAALTSFVRQLAQRPFSLKQSPLMRAHLVDAGSQGSVLLLVAHHIVCDARSLQVLVSGLLSDYGALLKGQRLEAGIPPARYADFVDWEAALVNSDRGHAMRDHWLRQLSGALPVLELPTGKPRHEGALSSRAPQGATCSVDMPSALVQGVRALSKAQGMNPAVILLGAYKALLQRYTQQSDIVVGMPTLGRPEERFESLVGYFVNMVAVRTRLDPALGFLPMLKELQLTVVDGLDHAAYPFPALVRELKLPRAPGRSPVFQVAFEYQNAAVIGELKQTLAQSAGLTVEVWPGIHQDGEYELALEVHEREAGFTLNFKYDANLHEPDMIERMAGHFTVLLEGALRQPDQPLRDLPLLSAQERGQLAAWNDTARAYPHHLRVDQLFAQRAERQPDALAVAMDGETLSYAGLDEEVGRVAARLREQGVQAGHLVGVHVNRSPDMLVALLGILRAGGAYVPLDPAYPDDRLRHMLQDSGARLVLTQAPLQDRLRSLLPHGSHALDIDGLRHEGEAWAGASHAPDDLAYVIYTSGSTGLPKGVMVPHGALTNFLMSMAERPGLTERDRLLAVTTYSFDIAGLELFLPLVVGAQCHICPAATTRNAEALRQEIARVQPTVMQATPATWTMLFQSGWRNGEGLTALCGGEALPDSLRRSFKDSGTQAWNLFGPTETTIWSTAAHLEPEGPITIGTPIGNTQIHVLDAQLRPLPVMVPGEMHIGGDGVARGYLNQPELTASRFIDDPFAQEGAKLYKTGDLVRWLGNGQIEYLGRIDTQVKLRGYRIELGEIEKVLCEHPTVSQGAVVVHETAERKQLVAFLKSKAGEARPPAKACRDHLKLKLPEYMVPAHFLWLDDLPLTPSGKVDRKALAARPLAEPANPAQAASASPLAFEVQGRVLAIWRRALGNPELGLDDSFFDGGGDSLLAVTVAQDIEKAFGEPFTVTHLFEHGTARATSQHLSKRRESLGEEATTRAGKPRPAAVAPGLPAVRHGAVDAAWPDYYQDCLAIVGMSCQVPGAGSHRAFWDNLREGRESVRIFGADELRQHGVPEALIRHPDHVPVRAAIEGKDLFDPEFFKISPKDAELMDPQSRLLLQNAWHALEDAGYAPADVPDTSVFMSVSASGYGLRLVGENTAQVITEAEDYLAWVLAQPGTTPTLVSHKLGLTGPSHAVHSNCSSSLVALQAAFQSIRCGESRAALVGASTLFAADGFGYLHQRGMNFSSDGHIKAFDAGADGMVPGEGVVVLMVKGALQALSDGDHIHALVRGVGLNNDGADKAGFYAPSVQGQRAVIEKVLKATGVEPGSIGYVETHGTGTVLGDPIEFAALREVYAQATDETQFCGIGSVKTNIGHLDTAAGLAGCVKVALALTHAEIPPTLNYTQPNPRIKLEGSPFYVADRRQAWPAGERPRRAALSSFGIGGTNAHAILEQAPMLPACADPASGCWHGEWIVPLSARDDERLKACAVNLLAFLQAPGTSAPIDLQGLAYTLQVGRQAMACRVVFLVRDLAALVDALSAYTAGESVDACVAGRVDAGSHRLDVDDGDVLLEKWLHEGSVRKLASAWVQGMPMNWRRLYQAGTPRRLSLPTYPFARQRYWAGSKAAEVLEASAMAMPVAEVEPAFELMAFEERWEPCAPALPQAGPDAVGGVVLCLVSGQEAQRTVAARMAELAPSAQLVFVVRGGDAAADSQPHVHHVDELDTDGQARVLASALARFGQPGRVLCFWPLEDGSASRAVPSFLRFVQALKRLGLPCGKVLIAGQAESQADQADLESMMALPGSLGHAMPGTQVAVVVDAFGGERLGLDAWVSRLWQEACLDRPSNALYRQGQRHVCRVKPLPLPSSQAPAVLRPSGHYLVTGGSGALGHAFACHLARHFSARLVLTGRRAPDAHIEQQLQALRDLGGQALYVQADAADEPAMRQALAQGRESFGPLHGVLHAAGVMDARPFQDKSVDDLLRNMSPKTDGLRVLDLLLQDQPVDFLCCFGSSAGVLGDGGAGDYAMANRFLSAYARLTREGGSGRSPRMLTIGWPLWEEGAMRPGSAQQTEFYLRSSGQQALPTAEGLRLFENLLAQGGDQPLVFLGQKHRVHRFLGLVQDQVEGRPDAARAAPSVAGAAWRPAMKGLTLTQCVAWDLKELASESLKMSRSKLDPAVNLADFGFDSVNLASFAKRLSTHFGFEFAPTVFFSHPTLAQLESHLVGTFGDALAALYAPPSEQVASSLPVAMGLRATASVLPVEALAPDRPATPSDESFEPIAIIGMSGRFPGARTVDEFWRILREGQDVVAEVPVERFDWRAFHGDPAKEPGKTNGKWLGALDGVDEFDPLFFELSPREAAAMDPRQRLLLQEAWRALEDAGQDRARLQNGRTGVFVGVEQGDYRAVTADEGNVTSNHDGILAARLAYVLDLHGPVMAINTSCSSGLVAAHQACVSLRAGECDTAIAAGVNLLLSPDIFVGLGQAGMLSSDGKCHAFDVAANGMVPGEAVVALVLKPWRQAMRDGDPVYAVIKGSGINYDGKTNGITAPSGAAQSRLLRDVYARHRIDPAQVEYIVTHGTGTRLGDPIEINALYDAFKAQPQRQQPCALTSTKTNFGHTFAASGLLNLVCLVQAMRHEAIPPSLHCAQESDYIPWSSSPFRVNKHLMDWPSRAGRPRLGAVSAFGMSGTNAHMVVQSHDEPDIDAATQALPCVLLALSAKTAEALQARIADLRAALQAGHWSPAEMAAMSHTLLSGRQHFSHRCAVVVQDRDDAVHVLAQTRGLEKLPNLFMGQVPRQFAGQSVLQRHGEQLLGQVADRSVEVREALLALGDLYCQGYELPWRDLFGGQPPRRIHLPTYPFARERHWASPRIQQAVGSERLHPLVHRNTSDLNEQRFTSTFLGTEFFLADHVVGGRRVLPGAAHLEMAREAVRRALGPDGQQEAGAAIRLSQVVFVRPAVAEGGPLTLHTVLEAGADGQIAYEIHQASEDGDALLSQGLASLGTAPGAEPLVHDVASLRAITSRRDVSGQACQEAFQRMGLAYGPAHQGLQVVHTGEDADGRPVALGELALPPALVSGMNDFVLHPGLLDAAFQVSLGLMLAHDQDVAPARPMVPFALTSLDVLHGMPAEPLVYVRFSAGSSPGAAVHKLDLDIMDRAGQVCVRLREFSSRALEAAAPVRASPAAAPVVGPVGTLVLKPAWVAKAEAAQPAQPLAKRHVLLVGHHVDPEALAAQMPDAEVSQLLPAMSSTSVAWGAGGAALFGACAEALMAKVQGILAARLSGKVLVQLLVARHDDEGTSTLQALGALLRTAAQENPQCVGQLVLMAPSAPVDEVARRLLAEGGGDEALVTYRHGGRHVLQLEELPGGEPAPVFWQADGVYLLTGGLGGLARLVAQDIARHAPGARLMLTGRSALNGAGRTALDALRRQGVVVDYRQADVAQAAQVALLVAETVDLHGRIDGVVHCAGVLRDNFLLKKTAAELREVLRPKVDAADVLDEATRHLPLGCFVLFASTSGVFGNVAQADYAMANAYLDAFAHRRAEQVLRGERQGRSLSIDWPLWEDGGMKVDAAVQDRARRLFGMSALPGPMGLAVLHQALARDAAQLVVLAGDTDRLKGMVARGFSAVQPEPLPALAPTPNLAMPDDALRDKTARYLTGLMAKTLKLSADRIDARAPLAQYGIDSIMVTDLTSVLERTFGALSKTLFFEYQTIDDLAAYFLQAHHGRLAALLGGAAKEAAPPAPLAQPVDEPRALGTRRTRRRFGLEPKAGAAHVPRSAEALDIAIIGISGRYPQARNLEEYWHNLTQGLNCITEVPTDRWAHDRYFDTQRGKLGKSYSKWGGFIDGFDEFDPLFFNMSPRDAQGSDPQERVFLQCAYSAIEDAGYTREALRRKHHADGLPGQVGVFVGVMYQDYQLYGAQAQVSGDGFALSSQPASIANRVSYFCGFHGPSVAVDTMCSSSLTAIHLAAHSVLRGECGLAIAGGVNLTVHPNKYLALSQGQFASSEGLCRSFGEGGDGYVPGEGVGAVLLKPLAQAIADGDQIHGVIKGSALNHGGKTNGYTVPNPNAQAQVIGQAIRQAGVDPRAISYVEAHGTGTPLGDPIEITGLNKAFGAYEQGGQRCAIGSVKSNIGHCESASGMAGLTKILLQMKHGLLVPSLHSQALNANIDFDRTRFEVQQTLQDWHRPVLAIGSEAPREMPRIAGLSSFGAGGANAHLVIEEHRHERACVAPLVSRDRPVLVILSARDDERLGVMAAGLCAALQAEHWQDQDLADIAYTLQVGREAFSSRLACLCADLPQLRDQLSRFAAGEAAGQIPEVYRGQRSDQDGLDILSTDEDLGGLVQAWVAKGKLGKLAEMWVKGLSIDWSTLHGPQAPRRISLPGYAFLPQRFWVPSLIEGKAEADGHGHGRLHALVHRNTSDFEQQCFSSTFTGEEPFLRDHRVNGSRILPGVAYLEMAREAVKLALGARWTRETPEGLLSLEQVVFMRPLAVDAGPVETQVLLSPQEDGRVAFSVRSGHGDEGHAHSQGFAVVMSDGPAEAPTLDLSSLRQCLGEHHLGAVQCQALFEAMGLAYGPAHQGLQSVRTGRDSAGRLFALGELAMPSAASPEHHVLHPSMLDAALQACIGLVDALEPGARHQPRIPFELGQLTVFSAIPAHAWVVVHVQNETPSPVQHLDIDVVADDGRVCASLRGFASRVMGQGGKAASAAVPLVGELTTTTRWQLLEGGAASSQAGVIWPAPDERVLLVGGSAAQRAPLLSLYPASLVMDLGAHDSIDVIATRLDASPFDHLFWLAPPSGPVELDSPALIEAQGGGVLAGFRLIKALLSLGFDARALSMTVVTGQSEAVVPGDPVHPAHAGIHGLVGSLAKEFSRWRIRLLDMPGEDDQILSWPVALGLPADPMGNARALRHGQWYRQAVLPCLLPEPSAPVFRHGGTYVVLGGAGGVGEVFTEYLIRQYDAQVVWIGRRALDDTIGSQCARLGALGKAPRYLSADATDAQALLQARAQIQNELGPVHGVVHATIVLKDQALLKMEEATFHGALKAKVDVSVNLARVFGQDPLDFILFFSSMQTLAKLPGQSNYAAGCTFADSYAKALDQVLDVPVKVVNWGYWGSVGIVASQAYRERMARAGQGSIEPAEAMALLERLLAAPVDQVGFLKTTDERVARQMGMDGSQAIAIAAAVPAAMAALPPVTHLPPPLAVDDVVRQMQDFESRLAAMLWAQLREAGLFRSGLQSVDEASALIGMAPASKPWLQSTLDVLVRHGHLRPCGGQYEAVASSSEDAAALWHDWDQAMVQVTEASQQAQWRLVDTMLRHLPEILTGRRPATEVMFPKSSMELVAGIYKDNPIADHFNDVLVESLLAYIGLRLAQDPGTRLRLIEVGAGTGGTSAKVFQGLAPYADQIEAYCYTDISKAFLVHGQRQYGPQVPYLQTRLMNIEEAPALQGFEAGGFDVVIATNVLHATRDMRRTLGHVKSLLKRGGVLLLNEVSNNSLFAHLTFGMLEGWWLFNDGERRIPGSPALSPESWRGVLEAEGFARPLYPAEAVHQLGQQVVVAASDGVFRHVQAPPKASAPVVVAKPAAPRPVDAGAGLPSKAAVGAVPQPSGGDVDARARAAAADRLRASIAEQLMMPVDQVKSSEPLENYGVDSLVVVKLTDILQASFEGVTPTMWFEHQSVDAVVNHLFETNREALIRFAGIGESPSAQAVSSASVAVAPALPGAPPSPVAPAPALPHGMGRFGRPRLSPLSRHATGAPDEVQDIAIIGLSGRYPQAPTVSDFWTQLLGGVNCITEIPPQRWEWQRHFNEQKGVEGAICTRWGGFIEDADAFDADFFGITARDAARMDPQERLFLQEAHACVSEAGYVPAALAGQGRVGVFVGVMNNTYQWQPTHWSVANRVSYTLGFTGPSIAVDTACSSSLSALHLAVQSLRSGEIASALVGGVNIISTPVHYMGLSAMKMLSSDDECRSFGAGADGFVGGEGVGAVLIKPLARALADGDHIHGVIKGSAISHSGRTMAYMVPSPVAQASAIGDALRASGVDAREITCIEAHGTATPLGDAIELSGLTKAFAEHTQERQYCAIGSVKSNIGHGESASGMAGLTKVLLQMKHATLVPSLHAEQVNGGIRFEDTPFRLQRVAEAWQRPVVEQGGQLVERPRCAGLSAFGAGGANGHVIVAEHIDARPVAVSSASSGVLIVVSARDAQRLHEQVGRLLQALPGLSDADLPDMAFTLQTGREAMRERLALVVTSLGDLQERLQRWQAAPGRRHGEDGIHADAVAHDGGGLAQFSGDEEFQQALLQWMERGKLHRLADLWVQGVEIDWTRLHGQGHARRRVSLPTYPFARDRHWSPAHKNLARQDHDAEGGFEHQGGVTVERARKPVLSMVGERPPMALRRSSAHALVARTEDHLRARIAEVLGIAVDKVDPAEPLDRLALDSANVMQLTQALGDQLGELSPTLWFEYRTIAELAEHLADARRDVLTKVLDLAPVQARPMAASPADPLPGGDLYRDVLERLARGGMDIDDAMEMTP